MLCTGVSQLLLKGKQPVYTPIESASSDDMRSCCIEKPQVCVKALFRNATVAPVSANDERKGQLHPGRYAWNTPRFLEQIALLGPQSWPWSCCTQALRSVSRLTISLIAAWIVRVAEASGKTVDVVVSR